jgi:hypothetical protein
MAVAPKSSIDLSHVTIPEAIENGPPLLMIVTPQVIKPRAEDLLVDQLLGDRHLNTCQNQESAIMVCTTMVSMRIVGCQGVK